MTTYNSYQEAKIANPDGDIVIETQKSIDEFGGNKRFHPVIRNHFFTSGYEYAHKKGSSPRVHDGYFDICSPAEYCMTVEQFLGDGNKFVYGDLFLGQDGSIVKVSNLDNYNTPFHGDNDRYILRAAELENKMNIDKLETQSEEKPKRVKVEYVKLDMNTDGSKFWEVARDWAEGNREFRFMRGSGEYDTIKDNDELLITYKNRSLLVQSEVEITERDEFIDVVSSYCNENGYGVNKRFLGDIFDSNLVKLSKVSGLDL